MKATNKLINPLVMGAALLATSMCANAQNGISITHDDAAGGYTLGYEMRTSTLEAGFGGAMDYNKPTAATKPDYGLAVFGAYVGKRVPISKEGNYSYGLMGAYGLYTDSVRAASSSQDEDPFVIGGYFGLAHAPGNSLEVFTRIMPISYERKDSGKVEIEFFSEGAMGVKYFLSK
jgi:hypothetical protein